MIPPWLLTILTQFFWGVATFVLLPLVTLGMLYAKLKGQIYFRTPKDLPSAFEEGKPNPAFPKGVETTPSEEMMRRFFTLETKEGSTPLPPAPTSLGNHNGVFDYVAEKRVANPSMVNGSNSEERVSEVGDPPAVIFKCVQETFAAKTSEDFEGKTKEGIKFIFKKDSDIEVAAPSYVGESKVEGKEEEKDAAHKKEELKKDRGLGVVN